MLVQKRNGVTEEVSFDKILSRIKLLCSGEEFINKIESLREIYTKFKLI